MDDGDQLLTEGRKAVVLEGIDHGQPLGEGHIAELDGRPSGEVVAIGRGHWAMTQEVAVDVKEHRIVGRALQPLHQFAGILGVPIERLAQLDTSREHEGLLRLALMRPVSGGRPGNWPGPPPPRWLPPPPRGAHR